MNTVRMAVAALRSAADDLGKSPQTRAFDLSTTSHIVLDHLVEESPVDLRDLRFLILEIAQILDRTSPQP